MTEMELLLDDELVTEAATDGILHEAAWWDKYDRRSLTAEESSRLKVPKSELQCSVMHFTPKKAGQKGGFIAYTHRCASGFYDKPEDIPAKKLRFVSSTS